MSAEEPVLVLPPSEIDPSTCEGLAASLAAIEPDRDVLIDFAGVTFCDSSGLRVVIMASKRHAAQGRSVRVAHAQPRVARVFEITGLRALLAPGDDPSGNDRDAGRPAAARPGVASSNVSGRAESRGGRAAPAPTAQPPSY